MEPSRFWSQRSRFKPRLVHFYWIQVNICVKQIVQAYDQAMPIVIPSDGDKGKGSSLMDLILTKSAGCGFNRECNRASLVGIDKHLLKEK